MKKDIILAGVGGQGILSIAATIGTAAISSNLHLKQAETHGMSQRGGDVQSHLRLSSEEIASDLIAGGSADLIISVEPMEALRYLPFLSKKGWVIANSTPFINIPDYPEMAEIEAAYEKLPNFVLLDADQIAKDLGSPKSANIVVLGAAAPFLDIDIEVFEKAIETIFKSKGQEVVDVNLAAFNAGKEIAMKKVK